MTPLGLPLPNVALSFDARFVSAYEIRFVTAEPVPGTMPSTMPMIVPRISTAGYFKRVAATDQDAPQADIASLLYLDEIVLRRQIEQLPRREQPDHRSDRRYPRE